VQGVFQGSAATGTASAQRLPLTLDQAVKKGIQYNLGVITAGDQGRLARAQKLAAVAQLLPDINGSVQESVQQINLAAQGLRFNIPIPGFHFPTVVGPFNYFDAQANFNESLSLTGIRNWRSAQQNARSLELSNRDARDLVALAVSGSYLQILASTARIQTAKAQIQTAQAVYQQAVDRNRSGLNARIDVNRSLVELQTQQQRLTSLVNDFEKQKITLARLIGLPMAQTFTLSDSIPYHELPAPQSARIHVDALSTDFDGYVEYMPAASGSVTSLLPPENATGNFVKIVQRLPVRIRFKKNQRGLERLRPGMSVEPKVALE